MNFDSFGNLSKMLKTPKNSKFKAAHVFKMAVFEASK